MYLLQKQFNSATSKYLHKFKSKLNSLLGSQIFVYIKAPSLSTPTQSRRLSESVSFCSHCTWQQ